MIAKGAVAVPCGRCRACRIARSRVWASRLLHERTQWPTATFTTLTYDDEHIPDWYSLEREHLTNFFKRLRKDISPAKIKYFACGEYGSKYKRPHYHAIIFGLDAYDPVIQENWNLGYVKNGTVTYESARYVADYIQKSVVGELAYETYDQTGRERPFCAMSKGLGLDYAKIHIEEWLSHIYNDKPGYTVNGIAMSLPRYYLRKLLTDEEAEKLKKANKSKIYKLREKLSCEGSDSIDYVFDRRAKQRGLNADAKSALFSRDNDFI